MSVYVEALNAYDCTPEQSSRLFQYASLHWYEMQPIFHRASHLMTCDICGKLYIEHPIDKTYPYLNKLCSGQLVKL